MGMHRGLIEGEMIVLGVLGMFLGCGIVTSVKWLALSPGWISAHVSF